MNKDTNELMASIDRLVGGKIVDEILDISPSTRNRMLKDGRLSPPDVLGGDGHGNKWLLSRVLKDRDRLCNIKESDSHKFLLFTTN